MKTIALLPNVLKTLRAPAVNRAQFLSDLDIQTWSQFISRKNLIILSCSIKVANVYSPSRAFCMISNIFRQWNIYPVVSTTLQQQKWESFKNFNTNLQTFPLFFSYHFPLLNALSQYFRFVDEKQKNSSRMKCKAEFRVENKQISCFNLMTFRRRSRTPRISCFVTGQPVESIYIGSRTVALGNYLLSFSNYERENYFSVQRYINIVICQSKLRSCAEVSVLRNGNRLLSVVFRCDSSVFKLDWSTRDFSFHDRETYRLTKETLKKKFETSSLGGKEISWRRRRKTRRREERVFQVQLEAAFCQPKKSSFVIQCKESKSTKIFPRMTQLKIIARNHRATSRYKISYGYFVYYLSTTICHSDQSGIHPYFKPLFVWYFCFCTSRFFSGTFMIFFIFFFIVVRNRINYF